MKIGVCLLTHLSALLNTIIHECTRYMCGHMLRPQTLYTLRVRL